MTHSHFALMEINLYFQESFISYFLLFIKCTGMTLLNEIIQVSGIQFYNTSSVYHIVCLPHQVKCPSIIIPKILKRLLSKWSQTCEHSEKDWPSLQKDMRKRRRQNIPRGWARCSSAADPTLEKEENQAWVLFLLFSKYSNTTSRLCPLNSMTLQFRNAYMVNNIQ